MRKPTSFFITTLSILVFLSLAFAACGRNTTQSSDASTPSTSRDAVNQVYALAWAPDGVRLALGTKHGDIQVWNTRSKTLLLSAEQRFGAVYALAWSPDGHYLASASKDQTVQVWQAMTGKLLLTYHGHKSEVTKVSWSPDGQQIASVSDGSVVQLWNVTTGKQGWLFHL